VSGRLWFNSCALSSQALTTGVCPQIDETVDAEPGLSDLERSWLRASAYDCYDMLVLCDEFVNQVSE
jgi:hypothetical protein